MALARELTRFFAPTPSYSLPTLTTGSVVIRTLPSSLRAERGSESTEQIMEKTFDAQKFNDKPMSNASPKSIAVKFGGKKFEHNCDKRKQNSEGGVVVDDKLACPPVSSILRTDSPSPFRLYQYGAGKSNEDYTELLSRCNIKDCYGYNSEMTEYPIAGVHRVQQMTDGTSGVEHCKYKGRPHTLPKTGSHVQCIGSRRTTKMSYSRQAS